MPGKKATAAGHVQRPGRGSALVCAAEAGIAASCFDMYGPRATEVEQELDRAFTSAFGHDPERLATYRAAYALITACCFGDDLSDGHLAWCVTMLRRPDVREAVQA